ncbi:hypothetical protein G6L68_25030 [Agrobacterium fabrum]|uniref:hypothetical protein n=1 Tax=Agrobacterium fabrum TaxID=1176649 RepID=UPI000EF58A4F|nr:hypothetical protein [Agrobacterium fabrum]AYM66150.1 hypothetical protein At12D13_49980 [Agrobacterium fabrum]NTE63897.1 hypothetical protein [Agrobacterium fabrum]
MTATLEYQQSKIDGYLATFDDVTVFDRHHRALLQHVRDARDTMTTARDLQGPKDVAELLAKTYGPEVAAKWRDRARDELEDRPDRPFEGVVYLEIPADSIFRSTFSK